jgi:hypothetical protein
VGLRRLRNKLWKKNKDLPKSDEEYNALHRGINGLGRVSKIEG